MQEAVTLDIPAELVQSTNPIRQPLETGLASANLDGSLQQQNAADQVDPISFQDVVRSLRSDGSTQNVAPDANGPADGEIVTVEVNAMVDPTLTEQATELAEQASDPNKNPPFSHWLIAETRGPTFVHHFHNLVRASQKQQYGVSRDASPPANDAGPKSDADWAVGMLHRLSKCLSMLTLV